MCHQIIVLTFMKFFILYSFVKNTFNTLKIVIVFNSKAKLLIYILTYTDLIFQVLNEDLEVVVQLYKANSLMKYYNIVVSKLFELF